MTQPEFASPHVEPVSLAECGAEASLRLHAEIYVKQLFFHRVTTSPYRPAKPWTPLLERGPGVSILVEPRGVEPLTS